MASFTEWPDGEQALTGVEANWFTPLLIETPGGVLVVDPFTTNFNNGAGPWSVTLSAALIDGAGQAVPATGALPSYATGFNFHIADAPLGNGDYALVYDTVDQGAPNTGVDIDVQNIDASGDPVGGVVTLASDVQNVLQFRVAATVSGTYDLTYATVNSGVGTVSSQVFGVNGVATTSPTVIDTYNTVSGEAFSLLKLAASNGVNPSSLYIRGSGTGQGTGNIMLKWELIGADGQDASSSLSNVRPDYPLGATSTQLVSWAAATLQTPSTSDPLFAVVMRYSYVQNGVTSTALDVRTIDPITNQIVADSTIPVPNNSAGETIHALAGGGFAVGYGGAALNNLQAFDASGNPLGDNFVMPDDQTNFGLAQLPDGDIVVDFTTPAAGGGNQVSYDIYSQTVCFAAGARILTDRGEVEVERLVVGDLVATASGAMRPVRWLGRRRLDGRRHPRPRDIMPIRVAAHAFGTNKPARDLYLSPAHAIGVSVVDEVLIPAVALVNGSTIQQVEVGSIVYWHVELDSHDILLAENLPTESYIDRGNRSFFVESGVVGLASGPDAERRSDADYCRPFHHSGPLVEVVRAQLAARAEALGWTLRRDPAADMHLRVDGVRIDPDWNGRRARFALPGAAKQVWLASLSACPRHAGMGDDDRSLGVCIESLSIEGDGASSRVALDDPKLDAGFHRVEGDGEYGWRWTTGEALLPPALWTHVLGELVLVVDLAGDAVPRWTPPETAAREAA